MRGATSTAIRRDSSGARQVAVRKKGGERTARLFVKAISLPHLVHPLFGLPEFRMLLAFHRIDLYGRFHVAIEVYGEVSDADRGKCFPAQSLLLFSPPVFLH